jgi:hypothetical protein
LEYFQCGLITDCSSQLPLVCGSTFQVQPTSCPLTAPLPHCDLHVLGTGIGTLGPVGSSVVQAPSPAPAPAPAPTVYQPAQLAPAVTFNPQPTVAATVATPAPKKGCG